MIRDYKILENLGIGSYGVVYKVSKLNNNIENIYVIKQIPLKGLNENKIKEVKQEAKILSSIKSSFVVKYFDSFEENNILNIVMEYCEGGDLEKLIEKHKKSKTILKEEIIWKLFIQMTIGLASIHKLKILHRDLKTPNIFLTKNLDVKIGDLGVAKNINKVNFAKTCIGTPYYFSPEICEGRPYNEKSDIWALGCILYEMISFNHPFQAKTQRALIMKILSAEPEIIINNKYSKDLMKLIDLMLQKKDNKRPSCKVMLKYNYVFDKIKKIGIYDKYVDEVVNKIKITNKVTNNLIKDNNNNKDCNYIIVHGEKTEKIRKDIRKKENSNNNFIKLNKFNKLKGKKIDEIKSVKTNSKINENNNKQIKIPLVKIKLDNFKKSPIKKNINHIKKNNDNNIKKVDKQYFRIKTAKNAEKNKKNQNKIDTNLNSENRSNKDDFIKTLDNVIVADEHNCPNNQIIESDDNMNVKNNHNNKGKKNNHVDLFNNYDCSRLTESKLNINSFHELLGDFSRQSEAKFQNNNEKNDKQTDQLVIIDNNQFPKKGKNNNAKNNKILDKINEANKGYSSSGEECDSSISDNEKKEENEKGETEITKKHSNKEDEIKNVIHEMCLKAEKLKKGLLNLLGEKDYIYIMNYYSRIDKSKIDEAGDKIEDYIREYDEDKKIKFDNLYFTLISLDYQIELKTIELKNILLDAF